MEKTLANGIKLLAEKIYDNLEEDNPWFSKVDNKPWEKTDLVVKDFYYEMAKISIRAVQSMKDENA